MEHNKKHLKEVEKILDDSLKQLKRYSEYDYPCHKCHMDIQEPKWEPEKGLCMAFLLAVIMAVLVVWASYGGV